jgi:hypothetical protein
MTPEQQFVDAWKKAAPILEELQAAKLRAMRPEEGAMMLDANASSTECFYSHGLARWQAWMMRWRVLESTTVNRKQGS